MRAWACPQEERKTFGAGLRSFSLPAPRLLGAGSVRDREYAGYHQFGAPKAKSPARPFLPIDADLAGGTAVLTDAAWEAIRPLLERRIKQLILSGT